MVEADAPCHLWGESGWVAVYCPVRPDVLPFEAAVLIITIVVTMMVITAAVPIAAAVLPVNPIISPMKAKLFITSIMILAQSEPPPEILVTLHAPCSP